MKPLTLLSLPAIIGILAWLASWAPHYTPMRYTFYPAQVVTSLGIAFVLMLWIGALTSPVALVVAYKQQLTFRQRIAFYILNGVWAAISLTLTGLYLRHRFA